jgi:hypothetical protein
MPRLSTFASRPEPEFPVLSRLLWQALALGALGSLALLALPLAPAGAAVFGALPYWLVAAPAAALLTLHRRGVRSHFLSFFHKFKKDSGRKCALTPVLPPPQPRLAQAKRRPRANPERPASYAQAA